MLLGDPDGRLLFDFADVRQQRIRHLAGLLTQHAAVRRGGDGGRGGSIGFRRVAAGQLQQLQHRRFKLGIQTRAEIEIRRQALPRLGING